MDININAALAFSSGTLKIFSLFTALFILFPFAISFNQRAGATTKFVSLLLLPLVEIALFIGAIFKLGSLEDVAQYFIFADRYSRGIALIVALLMIFGLSLTLAFVLIENMNRKLRYAIKSVTLSVFSFIMLLCLFSLT